MPMGYNRILGDSTKPETARPHRVGLGGWPASITDARTATLDALLSHLVVSGYEGVEFGAASFARYFPGESLTAVARKARQALDKRGLACFGATLHPSDEVLRKLRWQDAVAEEMRTIVDMGGQFASVQFFLHPDYCNTGGLYREDEDYLRWCADRVAAMRQMAWDMGLNFYLEVHVDRITEDPAGCCRILDLAPCELNGDLSHFLFRGFTKGKHVERIVKHVGHTHVRMARFYGDLSAAVPDPKADWAAKGSTWQMFQLMKPALAQGLSSRCVIGESGPMHLVKDTLTQDALLVPLYRAMARYADAAAQGIAIKVDEPGDLKPWG
ncbi:MAG: TIM barrel protein [Phycisphaeraceae bacterium]|nr:TIM barrel protein [Phycisphaeraceae bacterium]